MVELLLLLLPVAAASGWLAAKRSNKRQGATTLEREQNPAYFKGLNYLLNEQPDKAIDLFVQMLEIDAETVETHLALGNLFRRRGEVERAIRIHQNLIARPTLDRTQRAQALLELGLDYMRAGLFDRAENLLTELLEIKQHEVPALQNLRIIYQQEKDWKKCLDVISKLESITGERLSTERAHYYCELALLARKEHNYSEAAELLKKAQESDGNSVRAALVQGKLEMAQKAYAAAIGSLTRVVAQDPAFISEVLPLLVQCHSELNQRDELVAYLQQLYQQQKRISVMLALATLIQEEKGDQAAIEFVSGYLYEHASLDGVQRLIDLSRKCTEGSLAVTFSILYKQISMLIDKRPGYQCKQCGLAVKTLHWQCPGCSSWNSIKPLLGLDDAGTK